MYWLRWHYHVKDIAGAPYKIKKKERKKRKEKQNNRIADSIKWVSNISAKFRRDHPLRGAKYRTVGHNI